MIARTFKKSTQGQLLYPNLFPKGTKEPDYLMGHCNNHVLHTNDGQGYWICE